MVLCDRVRNITKKRIKRMGKLLPFVQRTFLR
jgi:hypothetical protein